VTRAWSVCLGKEGHAVDDGSESIGRNGWLDQQVSRIHGRPTFLKSVLRKALRGYVSSLTERNPKRIFTFTKKGQTGK